MQLKNLRGYVVNSNQLARAVCDGVFKLKNKDKETLFNIFDFKSNRRLIR